jgi:hypothetical protein
LTALLVLPACSDDGSASTAMDGTTAEAGSGEGDTGRGTSQSGTSGGDADGGSGDPGGSTGGDDSSGSAGDPSALGEYCDAAAQFLDQCRDTLSECEQLRLSECLQVFDLERDEFLTARAACGFPDVCGAVETFEERLCVYEGTQDVTPTPTQLGLAEALCAACRPDDPTCTDDFFFRAQPQEGATGVSGIGASYLQFVDAFVDQIALECLPDGGGASCLPSFYSCVQDEVAAEQPASVAKACAPIGPGG